MMTRRGNTRDAHGVAVKNVLTHIGALPRRRIRMTERTTHRSKDGDKLYAVRDKQGRFKDVQTYKRAHGQDVKRSSKSERSQKGST
jgi:hypothetical protein